MSYIYRGAKVSPDEEQPQPVSPRRLRLLLVDENPTARAVIGRRLSHRHYDVTVVEDGFAAQKTLIIQPSDIILIDMDLQLLPAIGTMEKIRAAHPAGHACIVMIGGASDTPKMIAALDAGADDHIVKPFDFEMLDARLRRVHARAERVNLLSRQYAELDARIARRAMELGETRETLRQLELDRARLMASVDHLQAEVARLSAR
ncbi:MULTISPECIES: response regulator transcription factor [Sphingobium]|jgi:DNA-binding response OmpR family regulator|uniref:response regulator transcription factor n=1 Tax=Sphingobium TaxID=165695 RepID=UPI000C3EBB8A|nr:MULTISPECIES: response regulator [Sphingobium]MBS50602.1 LuxR family transcriptional regulator [Sphingobium sp.]MCC4258169.1 response regulator [Sphingobium lactosutens]HCW60457.1 LuxR family transcriptional regulator [Sphingobium sp.]|tara:strand:- start:9820 stop:10431 length:612 start_codon:yes stop_codon:yes gene_type:complete